MYLFILDLWGDTGSHLLEFQLPTFVYIRWHDNINEVRKEVLTHNFLAHLALSSFLQPPEVAAEAPDAHSLSQGK